MRKIWKYFVDLYDIDNHEEVAVLKKIGLDVRQAKRMVQDRHEWQGFVWGNTWGIAQRMNPRP